MLYYIFKFAKYKADDLSLFQKDKMIISVSTSTVEAW